MNKLWKKLLGILLISPVAAIVMIVIIYVGKELMNMPCVWMDMLIGTGIVLGIFALSYVMNIMLKYGFKLLGFKK